MFPTLKVPLPVLDFFAVRQMMKSGLDIYEPGAKESLEVINQIFDQINELIKDGRQFLVGNYLSAADIAFASFVSPVVLPEEHRIYKKYESQFPKDVMGLVLQNVILLLANLRYSYTKNGDIMIVNSKFL